MRMPRFKQRFYVAMLCFALFFIMILLGLRHTGIVEYKQTEGNQASNNWRQPDAPAIDLITLRGDAFNLRELKAEAILVNFWASWCTPCIREFPLLLETSINSNGKIILVAISNDDDRSAMQDFLNRFPAVQNNTDSVKIVWDPEQEVSQKYFNVIILPETLIINQNHKIVHKIVGEVKKEDLLRISPAIQPPL